MEATLGALKFEFFNSDNTLYGTDWNGLRLNDDYHRLYFIAEGEAETVFNGRHQALLQGHTYLFPTTSSFDYSCSERLHLLNVCFKLTTSADLDVLEMQPYILELKNAELEWTQAVMAEIGEKLRSPLFTNQLRICGLMMELLSPHFQADMTDEFRRRRRDTQRLAPALNYIHDHINERISVSHLSKLTHMSRSYFAKKFSDTLHISAQNYIRKHRIEQVKRALRESSRPLSAIADDFDFSSSSHMTREFKIHTGYNPKDYRNLDVFFD